MDNRTEVRKFLVSRRAGISPEQAGLPAGPNRRVPGLRRTEVAALAGVSIEYYSKLERGAIAGVSGSVLDAIVRALQLDDAERAHLFDLARAADGSNALVRPRRRSKQWTPHRSLQWTLDAITDGPAFVRNGHMDILAANRLARTFYARVYAQPQRPPNLARFTFLNTTASDFYPDWETAADVTVAILRTEAGRSRYDRRLHDLVGELSTRSTVPYPLGRPQRPPLRHGTTAFHHHIVGDLSLAHECLEMAAEPGPTLTIYSAEPGSASADGLRLLASWAASQRPKLRSCPASRSPEASATEQGYLSTRSMVTSKPSFCRRSTSRSPSKRPMRTIPSQ